MRVRGGDQNFAVQAIAGTRAILMTAGRSRDEAARASDDASKLQLRATELCSLEAWGRAYEVLEPARSEIEKAPAFASGFAELAWRAGEFKTAREILASSMPADVVDRTTRGWSAKMGWIEETPAEPIGRLPL